MKETNATYLTPKDVSQITHRSENYAYRLIAILNKELEAQGYLTVRARIPRRYFEMRCLAGGDYEGE